MGRQTSTFGNREHYAGDWLKRATLAKAGVYGMDAGDARVGISSYDKSDPKFNADGSIDLYFGSTASSVPKGMEANWLPTGEGFFLMFRFYGGAACAVRENLTHAGSRNACMKG